MLAKFDSVEWFMGLALLTVRSSVEVVLGAKEVSRLGTGGGGIVYGEGEMEGG